MDRDWRKAAVAGELNDFLQIVQRSHIRRHDGQKLGRDGQGCDRRRTAEKTDQHDTPASSRDVDREGECLARADEIHHRSGSAARDLDDLLHHIGRPGNDDRRRAGRECRRALPRIDVGDE